MSKKAGYLHVTMEAQVERGTWQVFWKEASEE